jgi:hypothetical protein
MMVAYLLPLLTSKKAVAYRMAVAQVNSHQIAGRLALDHGK